MDDMDTIISCSTTFISTTIYSIATRCRCSSAFWNLPAKTACSSASSDQHVPRRHREKRTARQRDVHERPFALSADQRAGAPHQPEFDADAPLLSGGADFYNIADLFDAGSARHAATTLLKPGGYQRAKQIAEKLAKEDYGPFEASRRKVAYLARAARTDERHVQARQAPACP